MSMKTIIYGFVLAFLACMLGTGKSTAQNSVPFPDIPFFAEGYDELKLFRTENADARSGMALCRDKRYAAAVPYLQRAAKQGDGVAMALLGDLYGKGFGVEKNRQIAQNMFDKGIQAGCPLAHCYRGYLYMDDGNFEKVLTEYEKAVSMDGNCAYACYQLSRLYWYGKQYDRAVSYMEQMHRAGVEIPGVLGMLYAEGKMVTADYDKAFDYLTCDGHRYTKSERLMLAELYYYGRGTGKKSVRKMQRNNKYTTHYFKDGESGRASITDALIVLERLVADGYEPATELYRKVKAEYGERQLQDNKLTAPMWSEDAKRYIQSYPRPRRPAIVSAGYGEIIVTARISSSGQVTGGSLKKRVLQRLDEAALKMVRGMPVWKPGTRGGFPADMNVDIGISFFPSYSVRVKGFSLAR